MRPLSLQIPCLEKRDLSNGVQVQWITTYTNIKGLLSNPYLDQVVIVLFATSFPQIKGPSINSYHNWATTAFK